MRSISAVIPCFECDEDIPDAVESILHQTRSDSIEEVIIVDDGSSDATRRILHSLSDRHEKVRVIFQENQGPAAARNRGVHAAQGNWIAFLDADDAWLPHKIETQVKLLHRYPETDLLCSDFVIETRQETRRVRAHHFTFDANDNLDVLFTRGGPILMSTVLLRKTIFNDVGGFDVSMRCGEDADLWLRIAGRASIHHQREVLVRKRERDGSVGSNVPRVAENAQRVTEKIIAMYPRLQSLVGNRHAMLQRWVAQYHLKMGRRAQARKHALRSLKHSQKNPRALLILVLSLVPIPYQTIRQFLRKVRYLLDSIRG